jgi:hypothetical protein
MPFNKSAIAIATAAIGVAVLGSAPAIAQENCGFMHQRLMEAYQTQSPHYSQMLNHYNARCLAGSSQPMWGGEYHQRYDYRGGYGGDHFRRGW